MDYKERLLNELLDLARKRELLKRSLDNEEVGDEKQIDLLRQQLDVMTSYEEILYIRILNIMK